LRENSVNQQAFKPGRQQDAWATLRGFKYQIDLTLLRWLELGIDEVLELERGEDIDRIANSLPNDNDSDFQRVLEQIKHRASNITLRSAEALEFICNAIEHADTNPDTRLLFCYTTNAAIASERPNPFPGRTAGLVLWERIRLDELDLDRKNASIHAIRQFLESAPCPRSISDDRWQRVQEITTDLDSKRLDRLISSLQWNCGQKQFEDLAKAVRYSIGRNLAQSNNRSQTVDAVYERLALFVLKLLSQKGIKQLTVPLLQDQLAIPSLQDIDQLQINRFHIRFSRIEERLEEVEDAVDLLKSSVGRIAREVGIELPTVEAVGSVSIEPPPMVANVVERSKTVAALAKTAPQPGWLAIIGALDEGKSHLAQLVAKEFGGCAAWVQLQHDMEPSHATSILSQSFRQITKRDSHVDSVNWCQQALLGLRQPRVLVLDDLPRIGSDSTFLNSLAVIAVEAVRHDVRIVSTSRYAFPTQLKCLFPSSTFYEASVPRFDKTETADLLLGYGAPASFLKDSSVRLVHDFTFGHPLLATVAARYLRDGNWNLRHLSDLIAQRHVEGIADDILNAMCETLSESQRELLFRMSLAIGSISDVVATKLGKVPMEIPRPREILASLVGAWLQRESPQASRVSPLLLGLGKSSISHTTFRECHSILANEILTGPTSPWDAKDAISHFLQAEEFNAAGLTFHSLLAWLHTSEADPDLSPLLATWQSTRLPEGMYGGLQLIIRTLQMLVLNKYGESDDYVQKDLDRLMDNLAIVDSLTPNMVASFAILFLIERDFDRGIRYYRIAMRKIASSNIAPELACSFDEKDPAESLWNAVGGIQYPSQLNLWRDAFESLSSSQKRAVIDSPKAALGGIVLADRLMVLEAEKDPANQNWQNILYETGNLQAWAEKHDWEYLYACALKTRVNIHGEYLGTPDPIFSEVAAYCGDDSRSLVARAIVSGMYGRELVRFGRYEESTNWLDFANENPVEEVQHNQLMCYLAAVLSYGSLGEFDQADKAGRLAIQLVEKSDAIDNVQAMKAYGEVTILSLRSSRSRESAIAVFPLWNNAVQHIFAAEKRDDSWKDSFVIFSHVHSFLVTTATTGRPPDFAFDGSPSVDPFLGIFFRTASGRIQMYHESSIPSIMWLHSRYASHAGNSELSKQWLLRANGLIGEGPATTTTSPVRMGMIPFFLLNGEFAEALDAAFESGRSVIASGCYYRKHSEAIPHETTIESLFQDLDEDSKKLTDSFSIVHGALPTFFRLAHLSLHQDKNVASDSHSVATICRQIAPNAVQPEIWQQAAKLFDAFAETISLGTQLKISDYANCCREIQILSYFVAAFGRELQFAFTAHVVGFAHVLSWYAESPDVIEELFAPFVASFWRLSFTKRRFEFSNPRVVEQALLEIEQKPSEDLARSILKAVGLGFSTKDAGECAQSLYS
jgi:hypothetical protein